MDYLTRQFTFSIVKIFLVITSKDKINLPLSHKYHILPILCRLQHTQLNAHKSSHNTQTALDIWKYVGQVKIKMDEILLDTEVHRISS